MRVPKLSKALGRAGSLSLRQLADVAGRRSRAFVRARSEEREAHKLGLQLDNPELLPRAVPGAKTVEQSLHAIEQAAGRLPPPHRSLAKLSAPLLAQADQACAGLWDVLAHHNVTLGRTPDWHGDFAAGIHWDPTVPAAKQPIVRGDGSDIKIPWEISRLQHLPLVAQAFVLTGEDRYRDLVGVQLRDWIAHNPPGFGVNWTCAMEVALRAVSMSWAFERVRRDPAFGQDLRARVLWNLFAHGHYILGHLEDDAVIPGNHYVADLLGLIWLGTLYPAFRDAKIWQGTGIRLLLAHLPIQLNVDGGDAEASAGYHQLVFEMLTLALGVLHANGQRAPDLREAVDRMAKFMAAIRKPDGTLPQLGDADGGRAFRSIELPPVASESASGAYFPESGIACYRDGELYVLFAATPVGQHGQGGHGHNDKLAIELCHGGDLITDPGSFAYTGDPNARDAFRATAAHATLQLDGREQNPLPAADVFHLPEHAHARILRCEIGDHRFLCEGEHRGFDPFVHRRQVVVDGHRVVIVDSISGDSSETHELAIRFPLAPDLAPQVSRNKVVVRRDHVNVLTIAAEEVAWTLESGWYSPIYGARVERPIAVARLQTKLPATVTFTLTLPANPDTPGPKARS